MGPGRAKGSVTEKRPICRQFARIEPAPTTKFVYCVSRRLTDRCSERPELLGQDLVHGRRGSLTS